VLLRPTVLSLVSITLAACVSEKPRQYIIKNMLAVLVWFVICLLHPQPQFVVFNLESKVFLRLRRQVLYMGHCASVCGPSSTALRERASGNYTPQWFSQWRTEAALGEIAKRRIKSIMRIFAAIQRVATLGCRLVSF